MAWVKSSSSCCLLTVATTSTLSIKADESVSPVIGSNATTPCRRTASSARFRAVANSNARVDRITVVSRVCSTRAKASCTRSSTSGRVGNRASNHARNAERCGCTSVRYQRLESARVGSKWSKRDSVAAVKERSPGEALRSRRLRSAKSKNNFSYGLNRFVRLKHFTDRPRPVRSKLARQRFASSRSNDPSVGESTAAPATKVNFRKSRRGRDWDTLIGQVNRSNG